MPEILNPASGASKSRSERDWIPAYKPAGMTEECLDDYETLDKVQLPKRDMTFLNSIF